jgi:Asp-tRNA(Asn)/Glu-tRNA(Gln) amidotransferase C subunit
VIGEKELLCLAGLAALDIPESRKKAVLENLQRIEQIAQVVNDIELGPADELAPVWKP